MAHSNNSSAIRLQGNDALAYGGVCILWAMSTFLSLLGNNDATLQKYNISVSQLHLLQVAVSLPGLFIWLAILFAVLSIYHYACAIAGSKDSTGFRYIAYGLCALLLSFIASNVLNGIQPLLSDVAAKPEAVKTTFVVIRNYVSVVSALFTYGMLFLGSRSLLASIGRRLHAKKLFLNLLIPFALLTSAYLWLIFSNPSRQTSTDPTIDPTFGLPGALIVLTVALPYVVSWMLGVAALIGLYRYRAKTSGMVYKILFTKLVTSMTVFIGITIILQLLTQFSDFLSKTSLSSILGIIVLLYLVLGYAFILVAQGAKGLNKIETL